MMGLKTLFTSDKLSLAARSIDFHKTLEQEEKSCLVNKALFKVD
jgi:hypothetical protein